MINNHRRCLYAKKKINALPTYKLYVTLDQDVKDILDTLANNYGLKYTKLINYLLRNVGAPSADVQTAITGFFLQKIDAINNKLTVAGEFEKSALTRQKREYAELYRIFNAGIALPETNRQDMHICQLKDGDLVTFPSDWLVLNPDEALSCSYATVIECSGIPTFPHVIFFAKTNDFSDDVKKSIIKECSIEWPDLATIFSGQMHFCAPIGPVDCHKFSFEAADFNFHALYAQGEYPPNYEPPYGACIIRKKRN